MHKWINQAALRAGVPVPVPTQHSIGRWGWAGWYLSFHLIRSLWLQASKLAACLSPRILLACLTVDLMSLIIARQLLSKVNCSVFGVCAAPPSGVGKGTNIQLFSNQETQTVE